ncbi:MAG: class I SAM-dependent methyltransferase [Halorientalis sp.]
MDSHEVRQQWADRSGEYSPTYYAHYGPDGTSEAIHRILDRFVGRDGAVLELGCSSGRHLSYLHDQGFENLTGIEVNADAYDVLAEHYPDLAAAGTFHLDAIEHVVPDFEDGQFDAVFSVETLQHVHPDAAWVFEELVRITDDILVTVENEGDGEHSESSSVDVNYVNDEFPLYYRDWHCVFTGLGLVAVEATTGRRDTIRTFRTAQSGTHD